MNEQLQKQLRSRVDELLAEGNPFHEEKEVTFEDRQFQRHLAKLRRFATAYETTAGDLEESARMAGSTNKSPKALRHTARVLLKQCIERGIMTDPNAIATTDIPEDELVGLLALQARGLRPSKVTKVQKRDDNGYLHVVELREEFDEQGAQEKLAKIKGLYDDKAPPPQVNIGLILDKLTPEEKVIAEDQIIDLQDALLATPIEELQEEETLKGLLALPAVEELLEEKEINVKP